MKAVGPATISLRSQPCAVDVVVLDCDGVIFDSNALKSEAFDRVLSDYPVSARNAFLDYHRAHGGVSRYEKFRHFFAGIHPVPDKERAAELALERYAGLVQAGYAGLQPRAEALEFARRMGGEGRVYVVSGSDEAELNGVFREHGIHGHFAAVFGSPTRKTDHVERIARETGAERMLIVGDGRADLEAAISVGAHFIFLGEMSEWKDAMVYLDRYRGAAARGGATLARAETWSELLAWLPGTSAS
jgi:phosphoglycolate phosphatase-like HAD superfamily hydrolase